MADAKVAIIMGSDSDLPVMQAAADFLAEMGVAFDLTIVSAHRTPERLFEFGRSALDKGYKAIIAAAGGAAHLPGMTASLTVVPVIGVPIKSAALSGVDSLYSIVAMPPGIPVATVAINGAKNAAILACEILATSDEKLKKRMIEYKDELNRQVLEKADKLEKDGYRQYLAESF